jgi:hypothetical protein
MKIIPDTSAHVVGQLTFRNRLLFETEIVQQFCSGAVDESHIMRLTEGLA